MGVDTATFHAILTAGFNHLWHALPISRSDAHPIGHSHPGRRSLVKTEKNDNKFRLWGNGFPTCIDHRKCGLYSVNLTYVLHMTSDT